jgi:hypothetical protein
MRVRSWAGRRAHARARGRPDLWAEQARLDRLDSCRLAVLFGALAVEARLDRPLRHFDATDWPAVAHVAPAERFRMARRLIDGEAAREDSELYDLAVDFDDRYWLEGNVYEAIANALEPCAVSIRRRLDQALDAGAGRVATSPRRRRR